MPDDEVLDPAASEVVDMGEDAPQPEAAPEPAEGQAPAPEANADVYTASNGKAYPKADVEKALGELENYKKDLARMGTKNRMAEVQELKDTRARYASEKLIADQARQLQQHLRAANPKLYGELLQAMDQATGKGTPAPQAEPQAQSTDPRVERLLLQEEIREFERENGMTITGQQQVVIFERGLQLERELGVKLPVAVVAKLALYDSLRDKVALAKPKPTVRPTLKGSSGAAQPSRAKTQEEFDAEVLADMSG